MNDKYLVLMLICCFAVSCKNKQDDPSVHHKTAAQQNSLAPPKVTVIADLPDSLKPKVVSLDRMPRPLVVRVPERAGGFYTGTNDQGLAQKIDLKPPVQVSLPVLKNEKGEIKKDRQGSPFIMGDGGISNFTNYSINDGLAQNGVVCSIIDHSGNLWVGTDGAGVCRYDGKTFTTFNKSQGLAGVYVFSIMEDQSENLWFCTWDGGVSRYNGKTFTTFKTGTAGDSSFVGQIAQDKPGNFWFVLTDGSVKCFAGKSYTPLKVPDGLEDVRVYRISLDESGSLWFSTDKGARRYDGTRFKSYTVADGLANNKVNNVVQDKSGNFWFSTDGGGVSRFNGEHFTTFTTADGLAGNDIWDMALGQSGNLWFITNKGLSRYDGKIFTSFTSEQGLAGNDVRYLTEDQSGNAWVGVYGEGLSRYNGDAFTFFGTSHGLSSNVTSIFEDKAGNLWLASHGGGVTRYDGKTFTRFTTAQGLVSDDIMGITEDQSGNIWFGGDGGVSRYDGKTFTSFSAAQGLLDYYVIFLAKDRSGNLWFGTDAGASRYNGKEFTSFATSQFIGNPHINSILQDKWGNIWFGGGGGLSSYDGKAFITFTTAQGLAGNDVRCIAEDQSGKLWIGTDGGVSRYDGEEFASFTTTQGLADDYVYGIVQDKQGNIVISTNVGLTVLDHSVISLPFSEVRKGISYYNSQNGYPIKDSYRNALYCDSKGIIWAGTDGGKYSLVRFDPSALRADTHTPSLVIQQIKINEEKIVWNDLLPGKEQKALPKTVVGPSISANISEEVSTFGRRLPDEERERLKKRFRGIRIDSVTSFYPLPVNLVLPYDRNQFTIDFNAIEIGSPSMINYQYILEGYDKDWSPVSKNTSATFGNMHEGAYTFKVKAQSPNGVWSSPVSYSFRVLPPWWRTWWAYTFYGLCFLTGAFFTDRIRRRIVIEKERTKARERELMQAKEIEKAYTELKSTQAQLIQSEKMASLGELTAGIAHEIQNPLNFVNNFSEVNKELIAELKTEVKKGNIGEVNLIADDIEANEEKINHHGKRADAIVKGMLQHSRISNGLKAPTDINKLVAEYLRLAYHGLRAKDKSFNALLETEYDESIGHIGIIPQDIGRVILNLINNAFYAVDEKKKQQPYSYDPTVSVNTKKSGDKVLITVKDNGNGIPQKVIDKIFQPFFTTKPTGQGTGLGLSLAYDIVKAHGGEIKVVSKEGGGTEFIVQLPVA